MKIFILPFFITFFSVSLFAQKPLPEFTVEQKSKTKILISWINPFETCIQLNVQRSFDSLKYFKTIFSPNSPELPQNGFIDAAFPNAKMYYRIFYVLNGGAYFFSNSKMADSISINPTNPSQNISKINQYKSNEQQAIEERKIVTIYVKDIFLKQLDQNEYKLFRDSIIYQTKDTLYIINEGQISIKPFVAKYIWKPSNYIFSSKTGHVSILIPLAKIRNYRIVFYNEEGDELFEIKHVKDTELTLDKTNFLISGWYYFELYEDKKLLEKNKFYLPKDF